MPEHEYPKPDRSLSQREAAEWLEQIAELGELASIEIPGLSAGREQIGRARDLVNEHAAVREDPEQAADRIAQALAEGKLDLDAAVQEAIRAEAVARGSILKSAVAKTEANVIRHVFTGLGRELDGDALLAEARSVVAATLEEIRSLRPVLDGIASADKATEAGSKAAAAWAKYRQLLPRFAAVHGLVNRLRDLHWLDPLPVDLAAPVARSVARSMATSAGFGRPDLRLQDVRAAKKAGRPLAELLDPSCDAWEPGGPFTEAELREIRHRVEEASRVTQRAQHERALALATQPRP